MTILLLNKTVFSTTLTANTFGIIASYDLTTGGKGGSDADNVIIVAVARVNNHSVTTHAYTEILGLYTRIGGTLTGVPVALNTKQIVNIGDGTGGSTITANWSGNTIQIGAAAPNTEGGSSSYSGVLEIYMAD